VAGGFAAEAQKRCEARDYTKEARHRGEKLRPCRCAGYHRRMFSYRHAFHAGNHADVLKHAVLIAILRHLTLKESPFTVLDTHAGAGLYRLDGDYAQTSGEAGQGFLRLVGQMQSGAVAGPATAAKTVTRAGTVRPEPVEGPGPGGIDKPRANATGPGSVGRRAPTGAIQKAANVIDVTTDMAPMLQHYIEMVASFNAKGSHKVYPGSPFIIQRLLRERDKLKLFELHPTDAKTLSANIAQLDAGRQVAVLREDGFEGLKKFLPPPQRRALVLCDPSYEIKTDYTRVTATIGDALARFAIGTYAVWHPIIPRPEAHDVPRKLKTLATKAGRGWLHATLTVKFSKVTTDEAGQEHRPGLPASGMFIINPPHTLKAALAAALPQLVALLGQDQHARFSLDAAA